MSSGEIKKNHENLDPLDFDFEEILDQEQIVITFDVFFEKMIGRPINLHRFHPSSNRAANTCAVPRKKHKIPM